MNYLNGEKTEVTLFVYDISLPSPKRECGIQCLWYSYQTKSVHAQRTMGYFPCTTSSTVFWNGQCRMNFWDSGDNIGMLIYTHVKISFTSLSYVHWHSCPPPRCLWMWMWDSREWCDSPCIGRAGGAGTHHVRLLQVTCADEWIQGVLYLTLVTC